MFESVSEKLELCRLLSRAENASEPAEKADLLRKAAIEAGNWARFHNRRSMDTIYLEGENEDHF
jgi:hypothetical protein